MSLTLQDIGILFSVILTLAATLGALTKRLMDGWDRRDSARAKELSKRDEHIGLMLDAMTQSSKQLGEALSHMRARQDAEDEVHNEMIGTQKDLHRAQMLLHAEMQETRVELRETFLNGTGSIVDKLEEISVKLDSERKDEQ